MNKIKILLQLFAYLSYSISFSQSDINKLDADGCKTGPWKGFYTDTKNLRYEGTFQHGQETGLFTFYDNTKVKVVIATREFNSKDDSAYTIFYDVLKNKVSEGKVVNKVYEGEWLYYHKASKKVMTIENYIKGNLEGLRSVFYISGKIAEQTQYKNNSKNGIYKRYSEKGFIMEEVYYKNNEFDGLAFFRDANSGVIISTGKFLAGKKIGLWQFFQKGKLIKEQNMSLLQQKPLSTK